MHSSARGRRRIAGVQQHDVDVAVRVQLSAPVAADGHQGIAGELPAGFLGEGVDERFEDVPVQRIQHHGPGAADLPSPAAGPVQHLEPGGFDLEELLVAGQFPARLAPRGKGNAFDGAGFDFIR